MQKNCGVGPSWPCPTDLSTGLKLSRSGLPGRADTGLVSPLVWDSMVWHSVGRTWPLLQSHIIQSLPKFPTLAASGGGHCRFRLSVANCPNCRSKLGRTGWGYWDLGKQTKKAKPSFGGGTNCTQTLCYLVMKIHMVAFVP